MSLSSPWLWPRVFSRFCFWAHLRLPSIMKAMCRGRVPQLMTFNAIRSKNFIVIYFFNVWIYYTISVSASSMSLAVTSSLPSKIFSRSEFLTCVNKSRVFTLPRMSASPRAQLLIWNYALSWYVRSSNSLGLALSKIFVSCSIRMFAMASRSFPHFWIL